MRVLAQKIPNFKQTRTTHKFTDLRLFAPKTNISEYWYWFSYVYSTLTIQYEFDTVVNYKYRYTAKPYLLVEIFSKAV